MTLGGVDWSEYDRIELTGVSIHGLHGVLPEEKRTGHSFKVDAELWLDISAAGRTDNLAYSVSYADIAAIIERVVDAPSVDLIETLAERICVEIFAHHPLIRRARVGVNKPTAPVDQPFDNVRVSAVRTAPAQRCVLAIGSNLENPREQLTRAVAAIRELPGTRVIAVSRVFETEPVGGVAQDDFLNAAILVETVLSPWHLHRLTCDIEAASHRVRDVRWGPRTLDIDVISWGDLALDDDLLTLPHPRAHERAFVLEPLGDLVDATGEEIRLPGHGEISALRARIGSAGVRLAEPLEGFGPLG